MSGSGAPVMVEGGRAPIVELPEGGETVVFAISNLLRCSGDPHGGQPGICTALVTSADHCRGASTWYLQGPPARDHYA